MAEDLQGLLARINEEGIKKTDEKREQVLGEAKAKADAIVAEAKAEAERIVTEAKREQATMVQGGQDKLRQASRDIKISLESELKAMLDGVVRACVAETLKPEFLAELILAMGKAYGGAKGQVSSVHVLIPEEQGEELGKHLKAKLGETFKEGVRITPVPGIEAGVQLSFDGESVHHDFTDDAITEMLAAYANPQLVALLRGDKEG